MPAVVSPAALAASQTGWDRSAEALEGVLFEALAEATDPTAGAPYVESA